MRSLKKTGGRNEWSFKLLFALIFIFIFNGTSFAEKFIPEQPVMSASDLKSGMAGYALTVLKGTEPVKIPVKIVSVISEKPGTSMREKILIKFTGKNKLSQGMSGSPVFIKNKLIGAIRSGWDNTDQSFAMVTPIDAMCAVFNNDNNKAENEKLKTFNLSAAGLNANSLSNLSKVLGLNINQGISANSGSLEIQNSNFKPGDAIAALLVWGDVEVSAAGTVTATSKDGKFLAFGHDFLGRGRVSYPAATAFVHETVDSYSFPFKLVSPLNINGIITQDREAAIGGAVGIFPQSFEAGLRFKNLDTGKQNNYKFRVVPDEFLSAKLIEEVYKGLLTEAWGRKGQGTMKINLRIEGPGNFQNGFARSDIFFSDEDIAGEALKDSIEIIDTYMTQPFNEIMPSGFVLTVEATQQPKILRIENVEVPDFAKPGEEIEVKIKLRQWRNEIIEKVFKLKIPENSSGVVEVVARGGGVESMHQIAIEEGLKTIDSLGRLLTEFKAADANNDLIIELNTDTLGEAIKNVLSKNKNGNESSGEDFLPEELEFLSETKERRIKEGNLKIFSSDYVIDGMMRRIIHVGK